MQAVLDCRGGVSPQLSHTGLSAVPTYLLLWCTFCLYSLTGLSKDEFDLRNTTQWQIIRTALSLCVCAFFTPTFLLSLSLSLWVCSFFSYTTLFSSLSALERDRGKNIIYQHATGGFGCQSRRRTNWVVGFLQTPLFDREACDGGRGWREGVREEVFYFSAMGRYFVHALVRVSWPMVCRNEWVPKGWRQDEELEGILGCILLLRTWLMCCEGGEGFFLCCFVLFCVAFFFALQMGVGGRWLLYFIYFIFECFFFLLLLLCGGKSAKKRMAMWLSRERSEMG